MEERKYIVQRISKSEEFAINRAIKYYTILSIMNDINVTEREIQLVAFAALKGNISYTANKIEFCNVFNTARTTIHNMVSKLKKLGFLIKDSGNKIKVNPKILLDFENNDLFLDIKLTKPTEPITNV